MLDSQMHEWQSKKVAALEVQDGILVHFYVGLATRLNGQR